MIQQQYYTREKRGIFNRTAGYDTIAVSKGLKTNPGFIRSILHDKCFYDPPIELINSGESDITKYPQAITCYNTDKGDMILGKAAYIGPDFTGERNTFFMHNYVIFKQERENFIHNFKKIIYSSGYIDHYNIEAGQDIQEIEDIPCDEVTEGIADRFRLFKELNIDSDIMFKKLLYAVFMSVVNKKKIYISFDVEVNKLSIKALEIMKYIYRLLPYELRRNIGFITYAREPVNKKFINLIFMPKGGIKLSNNDIKKEYIFDFSQGKFFNTDIDITMHPYIEFCMKYINDEQKLAAFFEYSEEMMQNMKGTERLQLEKYNEFLIFYLLEQDEMWFYTQNKVSVINNLFKYLNSRDIQTKQKERLNTVFIKILACEENEAKNRKLYISDIEVVDAAIKYYNGADMEIKLRIDSLITISIINGKKADKNDYLNQVFEKVVSNQEIFKRLIAKLFEDDQEKKEALEWYLGERFSKVEKLPRLYEEMDFWTKISVEVFRNEYFKDQIMNKFQKFIMGDKNFILSAKNIRDYLRSFQGKISQLGNRDIKQFILDIEGIIDNYVYENIVLDKLSREDFQNINFSKIDKYGDDDKIKVLKYMELLNSDSRGRMSLEEIEKGIRKLDYRHINITKELIKNFFIDDIASGRFDRIIIAFSVNGGYDYKEAIDFIYKSGGTERVYDFILWASPSVESYNGSQEMIVSAIEGYFRSNDRTALRDKYIRKRMFGVKNSRVRRTMRELEFELSSGAKKAFIKIGWGISNFFSDFGDIVIKAVIGLLLIAAVGAIVYMGIGIFKMRAEMKQAEEITAPNPSPIQKMENALKEYEYSATAKLIPPALKGKALDDLNITSPKFEELIKSGTKSAYFSLKVPTKPLSLDSSYSYQYNVRVIKKEGSINEEEKEKLKKDIEILMIEIIDEYYTQNIQSSNDNITEKDSKETDMQEVPYGKAVPEESSKNSNSTVSAPQKEN